MGTSNLLSGEAASAVLGREGTFSIRPEKIHLRARNEAAGGNDNTIEGTVHVATFVGVSNVYSVKTRSGQTITMYAQNLGTSEDRPPSAGEDIALTGHPEHTFVVSSPKGGTEDE